MGYRKLLTAYMAHIEQVTGSNLVEVAAVTDALGKREMGELRSIAAELKRATFKDTQPNQLNLMVRELLDNGQVSMAELNLLCSVPSDAAASDLPESPDLEAFARIMRGLIDARKQELLEDNPPCELPTDDRGREEVRHSR